jgi:hypothetical protein
MLLFNLFWRDLQVMCLLVEQAAQAADAFDKLNFIPVFPCMRLTAGPCAGYAKPFSFLLVKSCFIFKLTSPFWQVAYNLPYFAGFFGACQV